MAHEGADDDQRSGQLGPLPVHQIVMPTPYAVGPVNAWAADKCSSVGSARGEYQERVAPGDILLVISGTVHT